MADKNKNQKSSKSTNVNSNTSASSSTTKMAFTLAVTEDGKLVVNMETESTKQQHSQRQTKPITAGPKSSPQTSKPPSNHNIAHKNPPHASKTHPNKNSGQKNSPNTSKSNSNNPQKKPIITPKSHPNAGQNNSQHHSNTNSVKKNYNQPPKANPNLSTNQKHPLPSLKVHPNNHIEKKSLKNNFKPQQKFNTGFVKIHPHAFRPSSNWPSGQEDLFPNFTTQTNWPIDYESSSTTSDIEQSLKNIALANSPVQLHGSRDHSPKPQFDGDRHQKKENISQGQVQRPRHNTNENLNCQTCKAPYLPQIYQCASGHSSCSICKEEGISCGICDQVITDMRNYTLEEYLSEKKVPCPHEGCKLFIKMLEMNFHIKECPFGILDCPAGCSYKMPLKQLSGHFDDHHPGQRLGSVGSEVDLRYIYESSQKMYLIQIGGYHFLFHEWVSPEDRRIYMAAQLIGTKISASKWFYEIHIYAKNEPHRLYTFSEACTSFVEPVADVFNECKCCVLPQTRAVTFLNNAAVNYKVFIKKTVENTPQADLCD